MGKENTKLKTGNSTQTGMIDKKTLKSLRGIFKRSSIRFSKRIEIINFFLTNKNNTVPTICRELNVSPQIAHTTLDKYFELIQTQKNNENNENNEN